MTTIIDLSDLGDRGFIITGRDNRNAGWSVSGGGDVNGDGFADVIVGTRFTNQTVVVFGKADGFGPIDLHHLKHKDGSPFVGGGIACRRPGTSTATA